MENYWIDRISSVDTGFGKSKTYGTQLMFVLNTEFHAGQSNWTAFCTDFIWFVPVALKYLHLITIWYAKGSNQTKKKTIKRIYF